MLRRVAPAVESGIRASQNDRLLFVSLVPFSASRPAIAPLFSQVVGPDYVKPPSTNGDRCVFVDCAAVALRGEI